MDDKENHPLSDFSYTPQQHVYTIHWQRETVVTEWDVMRLAAQTELCGEDCHCVMHKVKTAMIGDMEDLCQATGGFQKVYRRLEDANERGLKECLRSQMRKARRGIQEVLGINMESYTHLLKSDEIGEFLEEDEDEENDSESEFDYYPKKENVRKLVGCEISWGMNSLYDSRKAHKDLHFCTELMTEITCWLERRTLH
eukprot:scaffold4946_cov186-Amphora_coffeaeformis.AAC.1